MRQFLLRLITVLTLVAGANYIVWRWFFSLNLGAWWIAIPLVLAETYSLIDVSLFGMTMWRARERPAPPPAPEGLTVDVFVTTYNEPVELVADTMRAAVAISYPHHTWVLDDGARDELRAVAESLGVGYITRGADWTDRPRHAKAGNLNNALHATSGEFILVLDADMVARPEILHRTLGYFADPKLALVQTPQFFVNVPKHDPLGSQAPLFYGPILQGKDGWNAAFFCGSNAILRRDALMQLGVSQYVVELERNVTVALRSARRVLRTARRSPDAAQPKVRAALDEVAAAVDHARRTIRAGAPISHATYELQRRIRQVSHDVVAIDAHLMALDLAELGVVEAGTLDQVVDLDSAVARLAAIDLTPLAALESVHALVRSLDVDRNDEAQPVMPLATISVTEDMATAMRMHALGWNSVYHHEDLATGLAPEDLGTALKQRLRWAQGTMQVLFRENPLFLKGLSLPQRLMYFSTMWSYLSGFAALVYFAGPIVFLTLGILPVSTTAFEFFVRFLPFLVINQVLFIVASRGASTWRGQQYSLALFPTWIRATTSAIGSVYFDRPLGFVVTAKTRQEGGNQWKLVIPQIVVAALLVLATAGGITRLVLGLGEPIGTAVNLAWVVFDLAILSVIIPAVRYRGFEPEKE